MSRTIDNRTVQMDFENQKFERGVQDSLKTIESLKKGLNFKDSERSLQGLSAAASGVNFGPMAKSIDDIKNRFSLMGIVGITIIQDITRKITDMVVQVGRMFLIDPIKSGFSEFELKMGSIQTIMAGTGESLETVNQYLNDLNTYSDKTIYSFADMTSNIGKFTNAGVSLKDAVSAIQGVANVAALSGANANEASRAMYNFSQALSAGFVKLIDWKSIEMANMATKEFKQQLIDSAVAAGTLTETSDGMYKTIAGNVLTATKGFNESLTDQWLTTEALTATLGRYSDETTDIGKRAAAAAQDVKTFTMMVDTLKEAAQSGWAQTWELIVGNFEEGKTVFTELNNIFSELIGSNADARNEFVKGWKDLGGRTALFDALKNSIEGVVTIVRLVGDAFKEIFPPITAKNLAEISVALKILSERFKMGAESAEKIKRLFRGVFAVFDIGRLFVSALIKQFSILFSSYSSIIPLLGTGAASLGDWLVKLRDTIKTGDVFNSFLGKVFKGLKFVLDVLGAVVAGIVGLFSSAGKADTSRFAEFFNSLGEKLQSLGKLGLFVSKLLEFVRKVGEKLAPIVATIREKLGKAIDFLLDKMTNWLDEFDIDKFLDTLNKGFLGAVLLSFKSFIDQGKRVIGGGLFAAILVSIKQFIDNAGSTFKGVKDILDSVKGTLEAYQKQLKANTLLKIAGAIAILALALIALALVPPEKLANAAAAMTALFVGLFTTFETFEKIAMDPRKMATMLLGLFGITSALLVLSGAMVILSRIDPNGALQGVLVIGSLLTMLVLFTKYMNVQKGLVSAVIGLDALSVAILILSTALGKLGQMKTEELVKGVLALAGSLAIIAIAMNYMPKDIAQKGLSLIVLSGALLIIAQAMSSMGSLSWDEIGRGLTVLAGTLTILAVALTAMSGSMAGSAALVVAAGAILVLALAMNSLAGLSLEQIGIGLLAIAGVLTILGIAGAVLTPIVPVLLLLGAAMLLIGISALAFGVGVLAIALAVTALAVAIATLAALGGTAIATVTLIVGGLAALIPVIATEVAKGITAFLKQLAISASDIAAAVVDIALKVIQGFLTLIPTIVDSILIFITQFLEKLADALPAIVQAGYDILLAILNGIADNIEDVIVVGNEIIRTLLRTWGEALPGLVDAGYDAIVSFIDGLADAAEENIPRIMASMQNLGIAVVKGVIKGIFSARGELVEGVKELGQTIIDEFANVLGIHSPSDEFIDQSYFIVSGLVSGIKKYGGLVYSSVKDLATGTVSQFNGVLSKISDTINSEADLNPTIRPVMDLSDVISGSAKMGSIVSGTNLNVSATASRAQGIVLSSKPDLETQQEGGVAPNAGVQFIQNNYSPKELSRYEIWRQTKNQLLTAKGLVGAS